MLTTGDSFPDFKLPNQDDQIVSLADLNGKEFVIYFYPKDDTSGCTTEACEFTDLTKDFGGIPVFGVSPDSTKSHKKFETKHSLGLTLLADEEKTLIQACGLWVEKSMYGKKYMGVERTTYLVDSSGKVKQVWAKVKPKGHAVEVLNAAKA